MNIGKKKKIYLGLGSNSSDRYQMLKEARILINIHISSIVQQSHIYISEPWGFKNQDQFINQVLELDTHISSSDLYKSVHFIEKQLGKHKGEHKFGPRNIDIDILLFGSSTINENGLEIPHPRMHERNFVLIPLAEIAPDLIHPVFGVSFSQLVTECEDDGMVTIDRSK